MQTGAIPARNASYCIHHYYIYQHVYPSTLCSSPLHHSNNNDTHKTYRFNNRLLRRRPRKRPGNRPAQRRPPRLRNSSQSLQDDLSLLTRNPNPTTRRPIFHFHLGLCLRNPTSRHPDQQRRRRLQHANIRPLPTGRKEALRSKRMVLHRSNPSIPPIAVKKPRNGSKSYFRGSIMCNPFSKHL